jgi:hypothetical protein
LVLKREISKEGDSVSVERRNMGEIGEMNEELQSIYLSNLDEAPARRLAREVFKDIQLNIDHCLFKVIYLNFLCFFLTHIYFFLQG